MIDSIGGNVSSLLRAQQTAGTAGANASPAIAQKIINQTPTAAVVRVRATAVPQTGKLGFSATPTPKPLPRGSLVDTVV
jgi:hypothetical protein